jgi:uncharacterized YccA/Bax inhibitor family protein
MTLAGTAWKSFILLSICAVVGVIGWQMIIADPSLLLPIWGGGVIAGLITGLIIVFKPRTAPVLAPIYAVAEGLFVAGASVAWSAYAAHGKAAMLGADLVLQAGVLTFGIAGCMLIAYGTRLIKPTRWMLATVAAATGGVIIFSAVMFFGYMFFPGAFHGFWQSPLGLVLAAVIVVIAAFNLVSDFAIVENGVENRAPKYMEWYGGFAVLVTLVWLYVSLLRLLALLRRN